ncbi:hypothetical protein M8J75_003425 [Diaphorina citri]|nr:hypothetical protein M8J75_003425 [Diaphorina citri]
MILPITFLAHTKLTFHSVWFNSYCKNSWFTIGVLRFSKVMRKPTPIAWVQNTCQIEILDDLLTLEFPRLNVMEK